MASKSLNHGLSAAKAAKQDEFYTQYVDIQKEVEAYLEFDPDTFRGKVVYCNCDDPFESNFFKLLAVRVFGDKVKQVAYARQTQAAEKKGESNCPLCAIGDTANKSRIYKFSEMAADHVSAWSKGGDSSAENCQMLCKTHNQAKGNR